MLKKEEVTKFHKPRILRNIVPNLNPSPAASQNVIDFNQEIEDPDREGPRDKPRSETTLYKVINKLRGNLPHVNLLLLLTPSSKHAGHYKLHVIDRINYIHLGMVSISQQEMNVLTGSETLKQFAIVFSNRFLDLRMVALESSIIENLVQTITKQKFNNGYFRTINDPHCVLPRNQDAEKAIQYLQRFELRKQDRGCEKAQQPTLGTHWLITALINRINDNVAPTDHDLNKFFRLAEKYKLKMYIRPDLCWRSTKINLNTENIFPRFYLECFMFFDNYVGGLNLDAEQLLNLLSAHKNLLKRIQIANDVFEFIPIPEFLVRWMRNLCKWLGLEMIYDAFGEYMFDMYKRHVA